MVIGVKSAPEPVKLGQRESRGVRPGLSVPNKPGGMCGPQTTLKRNFPLNYERDPEEGGGAGLS